MKLRNWLCGLMWLLVTAVNVPAVVTIPLENRINAETVQYLTGPADQPLTMPTDVALDSQDQVYVADGVNDRIVRFTVEGKWDKIIVQPGGEKFDLPVGIGIDPNDRLWIADTGNHRVVVVSSEGELIEIINLPPSELGNQTKPTDVAITVDGRRSYIVDNKNHRLIIRENNSGQLKFMGSRGRSLGKFEYPFMVCIGIEDYVYVNEVMGSRVQQVSPNDRWSGLIGNWGVELGQFYRPKGIAADAKGRIYVSDSTMQVIQVFGPRGRIEGVLCDIAGQPLRFEHPMGLCFDKKGRLYVVELGANRVAVISFKLA